MGHGLTKSSVGLRTCIRFSEIPVGIERRAQERRSDSDICSIHQRYAVARVSFCAWGVAGTTGVASSGPPLGMQPFTTHLSMVYGSSGNRGEGVLADGRARRGARGDRPPIVGMGGRSVDIHVDRMEAAIATLQELSPGDARRSAVTAPRSRWHSTRPQCWSRWQAQQRLITSGCGSTSPIVWRRVSLARAPRVGKLPCKATTLATARLVEAKIASVAYVCFLNWMDRRKSTLDVN